MSILQKKDALPRIVIILGPTASGKTKLAARLAAEFNGEIVSADSRQVYREMDIGTGKDLSSYQILINRKQKKIAYHLIDIINPNQKFNVAKYKKIAEKTIKDILKRGHLPIVVGGSGLYISALVDGYNITQVKPDWNLRKKMSLMPLTEKVAWLKKINPLAYETVALKNPRRVERALEISLAGQEFSVLRKKTVRPWNILQLGLSVSREKLKQRIDVRVEKMIKQGLVEETKKIIKKFGKKSAPLETIGYKEMIDYLDKKKTLLEAVELIKIHSHQFAKRQMTWFKRDKNIKWIENYKEAENILKNELNY